VKLVQATEMDLVVAKERVKLLTYKRELLNQKLEVALAGCECWKHKHRGMFDPNYGPLDSSQKSSQKSAKVAARPTKRSSTTMKSTPSKQDGGN
jgi:hypothetical protein